MTAVLLSAVLLVTSIPPMTAQTSTGDPDEALRLLEAALAVAQSIEEAPLRADAVGRVAGELARLPISGETTTSTTATFTTGRSSSTRGTAPISGSRMR